jgi:Uma2 family endonuclease
LKYMADTAASQIMTAEELLRLPTGMGARYELVEGILRTMAPAGFEHGDIVGELSMRLRQFVRRLRLGRVLGAETGFILARNPDTVRAPDVAFVAEARVAQLGRIRGFFPGAPDLAVEVVSPSDSATEVQQKVDDYLEAGTQQVWVVYPDQQKVVVFSATGEGRYLSATDVLDGGALLPGFTCPVGELFEY